MQLLRGTLLAGSSVATNGPSNPVNIALGKDRRSEVVGDDSVVTIDERAAENKYWCRNPRLAKLNPLFNKGYSERCGTILGCTTRHFHGTVPIGIGFDHCADGGVAAGGGDSRQIVSYRAEVNQ